YRAAVFFFSSRRRHTRFSRDWSSDVCSSDLHRNQQTGKGEDGVRQPHEEPIDAAPEISRQQAEQAATNHGDDDGEKTRHQRETRSEERRVGKECRARGWREREDKRDTMQESD